jgi:hypothetical protein
MCAKNVVVQHNALIKIWRSHIFLTQSQWHLSITETGDTAYQATCTTLNALTVVCRPAGNFLFSANPFPAVYPSPSLVVPVPRLLLKPSLWIAVKVQIVQTLYCVRVQAVCFPLPLMINNIKSKTGFVKVNLVFIRLIS